MKYSVVQICNMALGRIGISKTIQDINEPNNNEARMCRVFFESSRDRLLGEMPWPFATRIADLQSVGDSPSSRWAYKYRYPADCISPRSIESGSTTPEPFIVVEDEASDGLALLCNQSPARLVYTARITATGLFSSSFASALAWLLASEIAIPLSAQMTLGQAAGQQYTAAVLTAYAGAMNGQQEQPLPGSSFNTIRG